jgi:uncharacterized protein (DUF1684 family)
MRGWRSIAIVCGLGILGSVLDAGTLSREQASARAESYEAAMARWRAAQDAELGADDGWLTVVGLFWLAPGANRAGSDPSNAVVLPAGKAPARVGTFTFQDGRTTFAAEPGVGVTRRGQPVGREPLVPDRDVLAVGEISLMVIHRGDRFGIRVRDRTSEARRTFAGREWYALQPALRLAARFVPYDPPRQIPIANVLGDTSPMRSPGYVEFTIGGRAFRLDPVVEPGSAELFFIFRDATRGDTYPGGRFLYAPLPRNGTVDLDFNRAVSPPCAFTNFATCPLPPKQNDLPVRIEAGERYVPRK